jgi:hypothetical protein
MQQISIWVDNEKVDSIISIAQNKYNLSFCKIREKLDGQQWIMLKGKIKDIKAFQWKYKVP